MGTHARPSRRCLTSAQQLPAAEAAACRAALNAVSPRAQWACVGGARGAMSLSGRGFCSAIYFLNLRGEVLVYRAYRDDIGCARGAAADGRKTGATLGARCRAAAARCTAGAGSSGVRVARGARSCARAAPAAAQTLPQ